MSQLRDKLTRIAALVVAASVVAVGAGVAGGTTGAAASAAAKPKWLLIPGFWPSGAGPNMVGSASGRGWMGFDKGDGSTLLLGSLRSVGGRLSFAKASTKAGLPMMVAGSQLVYHLVDASGNRVLLTAPLLANGSVGPARPVPDDPENIPPHEYPQNYHPGVAAAAQVGGRMVWVLTGFKTTGRTDFMWACCTGDGQLSDLSRFIDHNRVMDSMQLGRDSKGRIWLAWRDAYFRSAVGSVRMVELDPDTLAPRTPKTFVVPGSGAWIRPVLVCGDACRIVASDLGEVSTWAPGERTATRMVSGSRTSPVELLAASFRSGGLEVATGQFVQLKKPPWNVEEISVIGGDARGLHARRLGSAAPAPFSGTSHFQWQHPAYAAFVPGGLVFFETYYNFDNDTQTRFLAGFLPLGH